MSILKVSIRQLKGSAGAARLVTGRTRIGRWRLTPNNKAAWKQPTACLAAVKRPANKIRSALEKAGIEFIDENGGGPGVRLPQAPAAEKAQID